MHYGCTCKHHRLEFRFPERMKLYTCFKSPCKYNLRRAKSNPNVSAQNVRYRWSYWCLRLYIWKRPIWNQILRPSDTIYLFKLVLEMKCTCMKSNSNILHVVPFQLKRMMFKCITDAHVQTTDFKFDYHNKWNYILCSSRLGNQISVVANSILIFQHQMIFVD